MTSYQKENLRRWILDVADEIREVKPIGYYQETDLDQIFSDLEEYNLNNDAPTSVQMWMSLYLCWRRLYDLEYPDFDPS